MKTSDAIRRYSPKCEVDALLWLLKRYRWQSEFSFVASLTFEPVDESIPMSPSNSKKVWRLKEEGRILYDHHHHTKGCELCGDFPVEIHGRCHPTAPLRMVMLDGETMEVRCYIPDCDRLVAKFKVELISEKAERALTKDEFMTMPQEYFDAETDEEAGRIAQAHLANRRMADDEAD